MQRLLAPDGCPWDREQTLLTLRSYCIEEAFEVVEAIDSGSPEHLREELGDLLFQIVFQSELARRAGWFGPDDVIAGICEKMTRRHPHVFGDAEVSSSEEVLANWAEIKRREKAGRGTLEGVPVALPALTRAVRIGEKAARVGFDWPDVAGVREKVDEELRELDAARDRDEEERELGDLLFALASWARHRAIDPESALRGALSRFDERFSKLEAGVTGEGLRLDALGDEELERRWQAAKAALAEEGA